MRFDRADAELVIRGAIVGLAFAAVLLWVGFFGALALRTAITVLTGGGC